MRKGQLLPIPAIIFLIVITIIGLAYMLSPADKKILVPVVVVMFIIGVLMDKVNPLFSVLVGSLYWLLMEAADKLNIMDNHVVMLIFSPGVIMSIIGFLVGRILGRYILAFVGLG